MKESGRRMILNMVAVILIITFLFLMYTYALQKSYTNSIVDNAVTRDTECSDAIKTLVSNGYWH